MNGSPDASLRCTTTEGGKRYATQREILMGQVKEEAKLRERLATVEGRHDLAVELHAPSGSIIRIGMIAYYPDTDDTLLVQGIDEPSGVACQAIVPVQSFYVIFTMTTVEDREPERKPIGFDVERAEGSEKAASACDTNCGAKSGDAVA